MIELLQNPAVTMAASALGGWGMKLFALNSQRKQEERLQTLEVFKLRMDLGTQSAGAAAARSGDSWGKVTRRYIAWAMILIVAALVLLPGLTNSPAIVQTVKESGGVLWGLFPGSSKAEFHELHGYIHSPAVLIAFGHIIAFYFGQAAAKP
ncbi:hypothetical protein [Coraliomargarita parva]|uniref:hypothetical protein n=1 Tax=Coraliomargarita parva TaxID=3014050 RepID=UPI0022B31659|nr:hypothetical protein [Coraliomargarita parva]